MRVMWSLAVLVSLAFAVMASPAIAQPPEAVLPPPIQVPEVAPSPGGVDGNLPPGLTILAEFLYLHPNRDGLGLAVVNFTRDGSTYSTLQSLSWDGTPGFRVGARYRFADPDVEFAATFTYFHAQTQLGVEAPDGGSLLGALAIARQARNATAADGDARLSYAILDLDVGRSFCAGDSLLLRAFGGVRLASIDQSLKSIYTGGALGSGFDYVTSPVRFQGAGLTAGAEATWNLWRGFGLYGRGRLGLVSGSFSSQRTETLGATLISDESERYFTVVPFGELGAGLSYQGECFFFSLGYEVTDWVNMVSGIGGPGSGRLGNRRRSDLTLEALTLRAGFSF
jgi:hypothetical protein